MRRIGFFNYISFFSSSALFGIAASVGLIFLTKPIPPQVPVIPVIGYHNVQLFMNAIGTKIDPFAGPLVEMATAKKISGPSFPKPPSLPSKPVKTEPSFSVIGIMPPDTCILKNGSDIFTVSTGEKSAVGTIGKVTAEGVYVNGKLHKMPGVFK